MKVRGPAAGAVRIRVRVQPGASRSAIVGRYGDAIKVAVAAPPERGAANDGLTAVLAVALGVPRRAVRVVQGHASRDKVVEIAGADGAACQARLAGLLDATVDNTRGRG